MSGGTREVEVWRIPLDERVARIETLSDEERLRASRFLAERDARRYLNAHVGVRAILARYVEQEPHALVFRTNEFGKPALAAETDVEFNLAHSGECALVAVTRGMAVGVDVEAVRGNFDTMALAARFFAPCEIEWLRASPERFFEIWTRKEAFIKGLGIGVSFPLQQFEVCDTQVQFATDAPPHGGAWFVTSFAMDGYMGAVATTVPELRLRHLEWQLEE